MLLKVSGSCIYSISACWCQCGGVSERLCLNKLSAEGVFTEVASAFNH